LYNFFFNAFGRLITFFLIPDNLLILFVWFLFSQDDQEVEDGALDWSIKTKTTSVALTKPAAKAPPIKPKPTPSNAKPPVATPFRIKASPHARDPTEAELNDFLAPRSLAKKKVKKSHGDIIAPPPRNDDVRRSGRPFAPTEGKLNAIVAAAHDVDDVPLDCDAEEDNDN